jgi:ABC-type transporter Mla subunit MlaD
MKKHPRDSQPFLSEHQVATALNHFAENLALLARALETQRPHVAKAAMDASTALASLAPEVARGDRDVAMEIVRSSARLVGSMRKISPRQALH